MAAPGSSRYPDRAAPIVGPRAVGEHRGTGLMMRRNHRRLTLAAMLMAVGFSGRAARGEEPSGKKEAVWPGMTRAGTVLLPNGWSLRPAGTQAKLGDFPVLIAENPVAPV